jgi:hypothetical protein
MTGGTRGGGHKVWIGGRAVESTIPSALPGVERALTLLFKRGASLQPSPLELSPSNKEGAAMEVPEGELNIALSGLHQTNTHSSVCIQPIRECKTKNVLEDGDTSGG